MGGEVIEGGFADACLGGGERTDMMYEMEEGQLNNVEDSLAWTCNGERGQ